MYLAAYKSLRWGKLKDPKFEHIWPERFLRPQQPAQSMNCTKNAIKIIRDYNKNYKNFGKTKIIKVQLITYE